MSKYYTENKVADTVVRSFYRVFEKDLYNDGNVFDFEEFLKELERNKIDWLGSNFTEVMFEIGNRCALRESFKQYLIDKIV